MQLHAHAIGKFDPFGEAMRRHRDDHRDVARERALNQISEPLALALLLAEPVDDDEIGALVDGVGNLRARIEQLSNIELAALGTGTEILKQPHLRTGMQHDRGQLRHVEFAMPELHQSDGANALLAQIRREGAQHRIGILILVIDQRSQIASGVEHCRFRFSRQAAQGARDPML